MARLQQKKQAAVTTGSAEHPAFPARWLYGFLRALPGAPGFLATISARSKASSRLRMMLTHQREDTSIGVSGPHDFAVRHVTSRLR
jgi:hypothetical protein